MVDVTSVKNYFETLPQRFQPEARARRAFEAKCIEALEALERPYVLLQGDWEQRRDQAIAAVDALLQQPGSG